MARLRLTLLSALAGLLLTTPLHSQTRDWQFRWYWGLKGGGLGYTLPSEGQTFVGQFGGEWLITARRTALYVGYSRSFTTEADSFQLGTSTTFTPITFDGMSRLQIAVAVMIGNSSLQPYVGGGFVIETLNNAGPAAGTTLSTTQQQDLDDEAAGGFGLFMGGVQLRSGRKLALYAQYQLSQQGRDFLLSGSSHSFEFGLRYALLPAREDDVTVRR
jgi:hypothetical protein